MYKEIFVVLCLAAAVVVHAAPAEAEIEIQHAVKPVEVEDDSSNVEVDDLEGSETIWLGGRRFYGGGFGYGYGGYGGGYGRGYGGYGYGGYGGGYGYGHRRHQRRKQNPVPWIHGYWG